jgi:hypothetical protein
MLEDFFNNRPAFFDVVHCLHEVSRCSPLPKRNAQSLYEQVTTQSFKVMLFVVPSDNLT